MAIQKYKLKEYKSWVMHIRVNGGVKTGSFPFTKDGEIEAAKAYDEMAKKHFGEFANLNFKEND